MNKDTETPTKKKLKLNDDIIAISKNQPSVLMYFAKGVDSKSKIATSSAEDHKEPHQKSNESTNASSSSNSVNSNSKKRKYEELSVNEKNIQPEKVEEINTHINFSNSKYNNTPITTVANKSPNKSQTIFLDFLFRF